jgi:hypothetical protein
MQRENTLHYLRRKLSAIAATGGSPLDAYDLDRFLVREPARFYDPYLDSEPSPESVRTLVRAGCPSWPLINKGIVNEVFALLMVRRERGLATVRQARYLRDRGHPRPWSVRFEDVSTELCRLKEGRGGKN